MIRSPATTLTPLEYEQAADAYLRSLPLEHFVEATPQSTQREITLESFAVLKMRRRDVQYFSELLVQYLHDGKLRQVVPDTMLILSETPSKARGSYALEHEPAPIFWVLEYVSPSSVQKDYEDRFQNYERELRVPYCLHFYPEKQDLRLYHHDRRQYVRMEPDGNGRFAIPELDLEVGLLDGWVRYWHQGKLLELPGELLQRMERLHEQLIDQAAEITRLKATVQQQADAAAKLLGLLRRQIELRATQLGRQDILAQLGDVAEVAQLEQWLQELGG